MSKKLRFLFVIIFNFTFSYVLYKYYYKDNMFVFFYFTIGFFPLIFLVRKIIIDNKKAYLLNKEWTRLLPSIISILCIIINVSIFSYFEVKINRPNLIKADGHGTYIYLKKNGSYVIKSGSWGTKIKYYGKYTINNNIITLDKAIYDGILNGNLLKINRDNHELIQINKKLVNYTFEITENNQ